MIGANLPALQIIVPLCAAPLCLLIRRGTWAWALSTVTAWCALAISWTLLGEVQATGPILYKLGGFDPPWGISYNIDVVNAYVMLIVTGVASVVFPFARRSVEDEIPASKHHLFYAALLLCFTGLLGMVITGDAFNVFVFLEIASLSTYALVSMGRDKRALTSAYQYLMMGATGGTFYLIGVGLLYSLTGSLNIADLSEKLGEMETNRTTIAAFCFLATGLGLKLAVFPLHSWLPNAYTFAPSVVTAFVAATFTKVSFYLLARMTFTLMGPDLSFEQFYLDDLLLPLAIVGIFMGSIVAIFQTNLKRMLAYSSVAQIGYMVLGLSLLNVTALTGALVHLFNHALMKGGLFMVMACVMLRLGSVHIDAFRGLGRRMPFTMAAFVVGGLSLIGVPLTVGFVSKWYLVLGALEAGLWPVAVAALLSSLLAVVYIWRVVEVAYFEDAPEDAEPVEEAPLSMLVPTWIMIGATLYFGIFTDTPAGVAAEAAKALMGGGA